MRLAAILILAATPAFAAEQAVVLVNAPGVEAVTASCSGCHSLDYVRMNAPFLNETVWKAEVTKMRNAFTAPIDDEDAAKIVAYLVANYGAAK